MESNRSENEPPEVLSSPSVASERDSWTVEKLGEVATSSMDNKAVMEIIDMASNEHYMLMVDPTSTMQTIEEEVRVRAIDSHSYK